MQHPDSTRPTQGFHSMLHTRVHVHTYMHRHTHDSLVQCATHTERGDWWSTKRIYMYHNFNTHSTWAIKHTHTDTHTHTHIRHKVFKLHGNKMIPIKRVSQSYGLLSSFRSKARDETSVFTSRKWPLKFEFDCTCVTRAHTGVWRKKREGLASEN